LSVSVDQNTESLNLVLRLKEYNAGNTRWMNSPKTPHPRQPPSRLASSTRTNRRTLTIFNSRAKQTLFTKSLHMSSIYLRIPLVLSVFPLSPDSELASQSQFSVERRLITISRSGILFVEAEGKARATLQESPLWRQQLPTLEQSAPRAVLL